MHNGLMIVEGECNATVLLDHDEHGATDGTYWHCSLPAGHEGTHNAVVAGQDNWFGDEMVIGPEHGPVNLPPAGYRSLPHGPGQRERLYRRAG